MLGEFAPLALPQFDGLLVGLLVIAGAFVALGLVHVARGFAVGVIGGFGRILHYVPLVGRYIDSEIGSFVHWLIASFSTAELYLDGVIAGFWRDASRLASFVWNEIAAGVTAQHVAGQLLQGSAIAGTTRRLGALIGQRVGAVEADTAATRASVAALGSELAHPELGRLGAALSASAQPVDARLEALTGRLTGQLGLIDRELGVTIPGELGTLREWVQRLTDELAGAKAQIALLEEGALAGAGTAAVAVAVRELGMEWTRCRNWGNLGRRLCGFPSGLLDALLSGAVDALIVADLCQFAGLVEEAAIALEPALDELVNVQSFVCLFGGASLPTAIVAKDRRRSPAVAAGIVPADLTA